MEETVISKEELIKKFEDHEIEDTGSAWMLGDQEIEIIALHDVDPKFLQDVTNAKFYKITTKGSK